MKQFIEKLNENIKRMWINSTKIQKIMFFSVLSLFIIVLSVISIISFSTQYVPLYTNLPLQEVNQIKEELDVRNVPYELTDGGQTIKVPDDRSEQILVELAGLGIPNSGNLGYASFGENASWGVTDSEFDMMKLAAMQTELANLIKSIDGIEDANVMITLPKESVFLNDTIDEASVAIILQTAFGYKFKENQIESLYHLVSKAIPNLSEENISIRNQFLEYFDKSSVTAGIQDEFTYHQQVKSEIEQDIQKRLQQMLGAMVGLDSVIVSVTADVDFTSENRFEDIVEPVDIENMEGIPVSVETIHETYTGGQIEGIPGTGDEDIANYPGEITGSNDGDYELVKDMINYELTRIQRDIVESPYKVRDLGIQVVVDNNVALPGEEVQLLSQQEQTNVEEGITSILNSMITTSIDKEFGDIDPADRISIVFQQFSSRPGLQVEMPATVGIPLWMYITGAILILLIILLAILLVRKGRQDDVFSEELEQPVFVDEVEDEELLDQPETEADKQRRQIENMAKDQPEEFAKLLRSWITDE